MTLFMACNDVFRTCSPAEEYFEYGLWMPKDDRLPTYAQGTMGSIRSGRGESFIPEVEEGEEEVPQMDPVEQDQLKVEFNQRFGNTATTDQVADYYREKGMAPSQRDLQEIKEKYGDAVTPAQMEEIRVAMYHNDSVDHIVKFFEMYDTKAEGTLRKEVVENLLKNFGEPLSQEEVTAILEETGHTGPIIDYREFAKKLVD